MTEPTLQERARWVIAQADFAHIADEPCGRAVIEAADVIRELLESGTPGVMHEVDDAFYRLTVAQRDRAWREIEALRLYARQVVLELTRSLADLVESPAGATEDEDRDALEVGRKFLTMTERG